MRIKKHVEESKTKNQDSYWTISKKRLLVIGGTTSLLIGILKFPAEVLETCQKTIIQAQAIYRLVVPPPPVQFPLQRLVVIVQDNSGKPIPNVKVAMQSFQINGYTDSIGTYEISVHANPQLVQLLLQKAGYKDRRIEASLGLGQEHEDVRMESTQ